MNDKSNIGSLFLSAGSGLILGTSVGDIVMDALYVQSSERLWGVFSSDLLETYRNKLPLIMIAATAYGTLKSKYKYSGKTVIAGALLGAVISYCTHSLDLDTMSSNLDQSPSVEIVSPN